jgi:hypothetical protein
MPLSDEESSEPLFAQNAGLTETEYPLFFAPEVVQFVSVNHETILEVSSAA